MRVIKPYKDYDYPRRTTCDVCGSELEYDEEDIHVGYGGMACITCPVCGKETFLEDNEHNITLTPENIEFPTHFNYTSLATGARDITSHEIKKYIQEGIRYLRKHEDEEYYGGHITGNLLLFVERMTEDKEYLITISKDFYSGEIPFGAEDYGE